MIKVYTGGNLHRRPVIVDENRTLRSVLEEAEVDYTRGAMSLDGATLVPGDLDKTFAAFGVTDHCSLLSVQKADNA